MAEEPLRYMRRYLRVEEDLDLNLDDEEIVPAIAADGTPPPPPSPPAPEKPETSRMAIVRGRSNS